MSSENVINGGYALEKISGRVYNIGDYMYENAYIINRTKGDKL
ncbi:MAG: hypothetical protein ACI4Q6_09035 [Huintestinicola sp.]